MKQTLLLMLLALGMCGINVSAQTKKPIRKTTTNRSTQQGNQVMKFKQVGEDGYVWYKLKKGNLYGVKDDNDNLVIPIKYSSVSYECKSYDDKYKSGGTHYFKVSNGKYDGAYTREGTLVIPIDKHYNSLSCEYHYGLLFWNVQNEKGKGILDAKGKEVISPGYGWISLGRFADGRSGNHDLFTNECHFEIQEDGPLGPRGLCDLNGNVILKIGEFKATPPYKNEQGYYLLFVNGKKEYFAYNSTTYFNYYPYEDLFFTYTSSNSSSTSSSSAISSSFDNNKSKNNTTTVVVEHHRDPVPVQEWQQCPACYGSGLCPNVQCGGSGWYYIGDKARTCSRCHGSGKCTICAGKGGHYVTVYR